VEGRAHLGVRRVERLVASDALVDALYGKEGRSQLRERRKRQGKKKEKRQCSVLLRTHLIGKVTVVLSGTTHFSTLLPKDLQKKTTSAIRGEKRSRNGRKRHTRNCSFDSCILHSSSLFWMGKSVARLDIWREGEEPRVAVREGAK
jgi:hypothetical protein